jgi:hypothetical protein
MSSRELIATKVSRKILSMLTPGVWTGTVAAIFERSLNVAMKDDFLIHIGSDKLPLTPRAILLGEEDFYEGLLPGCSSGQPVCIAGEFLCCGRTKIRLSHPQTFRYEPRMRLEAGLFPSPEILGHLVEALREVEGAREGMEGVPVSPLRNYFLSRVALVGPTGDSGVSRSRRRPGESALSLQVKKALWDRADGFLRALSREKWEEVEASLRGLIGLGPGLTPSGDDFLAGFITAGTIWGKRLADPDPGKLAKEVAASVRKETLGRTTSVSVAMLADAADGEVSEPVQHFLTSLLQRGERREVHFWAMEISRIGASSGEDLLNGLASGVRFFQSRISPGREERVPVKGGVSFARA